MRPRVRMRCRDHDGLGGQSRGGSDVGANGPRERPREGADVRTDEDPACAAALAGERLRAEGMLDPSGRTWVVAPEGDADRRRDGLGGDAETHGSYPFMSTGAFADPEDVYLSAAIRLPISARG